MGAQVERRRREYRGAVGPEGVYSDKNSQFIKPIAGLKKTACK